MIRQPQLKLYHLKPKILKHVKIINVSDKPTYDTSLERSGDFEYHHDPTPSAETIPSQTSNPQTCKDYKGFR